MKTLVCSLIVVLGLACMVGAQERPGPAVDTWVTATGEAAGVGANARDEAVALALRKAVEETCGVFIKSQSKTEDFQGVYDKVIADTAGYVLESKVLSESKAGGTTVVRVKARVSTVKFAADWARIAHTLNQEGNPRVIVVIAENTGDVVVTSKVIVKEFRDGGTVQSKVEDFFIDKGLQLMDRSTAEKVNKRDILLAATEDDISKVAAMGAKFNADVVVIGTATAKYGREITLGEARMHQYNATLNVRVVQTDSARILTSKNFSITSNQVQQNAEDKALSKLGDEAAPKLLAATLEAWRKRANVGKTIELTIAGMDRKVWKNFQAAASEIQGVQNLRLREITESIATIDVEYKYDINTLADKIEGLKEVKLEVTEQNANRLKLKVVK